MYSVNYFEKYLDTNIINYHYFNRYINFINKFNKYEKIKGDLNEKHHIIPRCLNTKCNDVVVLSLRAHALAHYILCYCFNDNKIRSQMINSFLLKSNFNIGKKIIKIKFGERTEKIKIKLASQYLRGENNPNYNRKSKYMVKDGKYKMVKLNEINIYLNNGWKLEVPKVCSSTKGTIWVNNGTINKMIKKENVNDYLKNGFTLGRIKNYITDEYKLKQKETLKLRKRDKNGKFLKKKE